MFTSPTDFNIQLADWLAKANRRMHRTLQARPADRIDTDTDTARIPPIPPVDPAGILNRAHTITLIRARNGASGTLLGVRGPTLFVGWTGRRKVQRSRDTGCGFQGVALDGSRHLAARCPTTTRPLN